MVKFSGLLLVLLLVVLSLSWFLCPLQFLKIVTTTLFDFQHFYSTKFPRQLHSWRNCHFRYPFVTASWTTLLTPQNWSIPPTKPTNQRTAKKVNLGSSLVYHINWLFSMTLLLMNYKLTFEFIYFEFYTYFTKLIGNLFIM